MPELTRNYNPNTLEKNKVHILLVDDEEKLLMIWGTLLRNIGYEVTTVNSSQGALEIFKNSSLDFDVVVTDHNIPDMPGDQLAVEIVKINLQIPIVLCSGLNDLGIKQRMLSAGIKEMLFKPFDIEKLISTIEKVRNKNKEM